MQPSTTPVGEYLAAWLEGRRASLKPTTHASYSDAVTAWITPHLGHLALREVTAETLVRLYSTLRVNGSRCRRCEGKGHTAGLPRCPWCKGVGGKPLGDRSVVMAHTLLTMAFADAVERGDLAVSPVERIPRRQRPTYRQTKHAERHWSDDETRAFLEHTAGDRLYPLWCLALDTGMRRGELSALTWSRLDLDDAVVTVSSNRVHVAGQVVEGTTKSGKSRRVDLDARTVAVLRAWKRRQTEERLAAGPTWAAGSDPDRWPLWTNEVGEPLRPDTLSDRFEQAQSGVDVPRLVLHGLRHTSATLALLAGVPVHVVSQRLGHANVSITLDLYSHVLPTQGVDAARLIGGVIYGTEAAQ